MKGRYLIVTAVLLISVLVITLPGGSDEAVGAGGSTHPENYSQLDEETRVLIGSDYSSAMPFTEGGTDPDEMVRIKSDATGDNYIGYYSGQLFLVLTAQVWEAGNESSLPSFTVEYGSNTYEFRTARLGEGGTVAVFKLGGGLDLTMEPFVGGVYIDTNNAPLISKNYCYFETYDWAIYDESQDADDGEGEFVGSAVIKNHKVAADDPTPLTMSNGVYNIPSLNGPITVSVDKNNVTYSMTLQPRAGADPSSNTPYSLGFVNNDSYPLQVGHSDTGGRYSMLIRYTDSAGEDFSFQYDSVMNYQQSLFFNASVHDEVFVGNAATHRTALAFTNSEYSPTIVYGGYQGDPVYRYNAVAGYDSDIIVAVAPEGETYKELRLIEGEIELTSGTRMRVVDSVIGAGTDTVNLRVESEEGVFVNVASGESFTIDGNSYTAVGDGTVAYVPYNFDEDSENLHGIYLQGDQKIILGNGSLAFFDTYDNTGLVVRAVRNENSPLGSAKSLSVDSSTEPVTVSTSDTDLVIGSYLFNAEPIGLEDPVICNVTEARFEATVDGSTGEFSITSGAAGDATVLETGDRLPLPNGITYTAVSKSVFTGSGSDYVMESGQVNVTSNDTTSITIRRPDNSTFTATGISQVSLGGTDSFTATEGAGRC